MLVSQEKYKKTDFFSFALQREKELDRERSRKEKGKVIHLKCYNHLNNYALIMKKHQQGISEIFEIKNYPDDPICQEIKIQASFEFL